MPTHPTKPCKTCPLARKKSACGLGGASTATFVGQLHGPFWLPCHSAKGYKNKDTDPATAPQCAGAAIFRANCGRAELMPSGLHKLPEDKELVYGDYAEFVAAHEGISIEEARILLGIVTPEKLLQRELSDQDVKLKLVPKKP